MPQKQTKTKNNCTQILLVNFNFIIDHNIYMFSEKEYFILFCKDNIQLSN